MWALLDALERSPYCCSISDAARLLGVSRQTAHEVANKAELAGAVELLRNPDDRRIVQLLLTRGGRAVLASARAAEASRVGVLLNGLDSRSVAVTAHVFACHPPAALARRARAALPLPCGVSFRSGLGKGSERRASGSARDKALHARSPARRSSGQPTISTPLSAHLTFVGKPSANLTVCAGQCYAHAWTDSPTAGRSLAIGQRASHRAARTRTALPLPSGGMSSPGSCARAEPGSAAATAAPARPAGGRGG